MCANFSFCCCGLQFSHYFWPSVIGIVPGLIIYVWLGSLAIDVTAAFAGEGVTPPPAGMTTAAVGGLCRVLLTVRRHCWLGISYTRLVEQ